MKPPDARAHLRGGDHEHTDRVASLAAVLSLALAPVLIGQQPQSEGLFPLAVRYVDPIPEDEPIPPDTGGPAEIPSPLPIDPDQYRELKERARTDPRAQPPDTVLSPAGKQLSPAVVVASPSTTQFAGLAYVEGNPSDVNLGRSAQRTIQAVNTRLRIWDSSNNVIQTKTLKEFFSTGNTTFDPKVLYDRIGPNQRFFITATQDTASRTFLAVSRSPDPPDLNPWNWCRYSFSTADDFDASTSTT